MSNSGPIYTTYYVTFTITGSATWAAPATCKSPITFWIVGGGGAHDNGGAGGGGGGAATGAYAVVGEGGLEEMVDQFLEVVLSTYLEQRVQTLFLTLSVEVRLRQGVKEDTQAAPRYRKTVLVVQRRRLLAAAVEARVEALHAEAVAVVVRQAAGRMVLLVFLLLLLEQLEQAGQVFHLRLLTITEEMPKPMVWVEMAE